MFLFSKSTRRSKEDAEFYVWSVVSFKSVISLNLIRNFIILCVQLLKIIKNCLALLNLIWFVGIHYFFKRIFYFIKIIQKTIIFWYLVYFVVLQINECLFYEKANSIVVFIHFNINFIEFLIVWKLKRF